MNLQEAREQLFAAPFGRFVEVRTELGAELTRGGQKEDSRKLKGIHRPSISAWATNQVVRLAPEDVRQFLDASDHLYQVQSAMLSGQSDRSSYQNAAVD